MHEPVPEGAFQARRSQPASRNGDAHFRILLEKLPAGAYTCDPEGLITYYNGHAVQLWGRAPKLNDPADRYCGSFKLFSVDGSPISHDSCWMALALKNDEGYNEREIVVERPDGQHLTALAHANPIHDESGELVGAVNVLVDISERKRVEEELRTVREAERHRIARDLHDGVLQELAVVVQRLEVARMEQGARYGDSASHTDLRQEIGTLRRAASQLRQAVYDLRSERTPPFLEAVETLVEVNAQRPPECKIELEVQDGFPREVPDETGRELLRILHEALANAVCHSKARNVRVGLGLEGGGVMVAEVADDGQGFDPSSAKGGVGIEGMHERASLLGADMVVRSEPGKGTSVRVRVTAPS